MIIAATEHDKMMAEIMCFTETIVGVAEMRDIPATIRADTILLAEQLFHKVIMDRMIVQCVQKSTPCDN